MGGVISQSRVEKSDALSLCRERKRFIKQAIDSRYALSAAHLSYIQSLRNIGIALRRFAEAEAFIETDLEKSPSHSSYPSPSPSQSHNAESPSPNLFLSPPPSLSTLNYIKPSVRTAVTVKLDPCLLQDEILTFPPPPPPPTELDSSWDYFDPVDDSPSFRFVHENRFETNFDKVKGLKHFRGEEERGEICDVKGDGELVSVGLRLRPEGEDNAALEQCGSKRETTGLEKYLCDKREDSSEFITHRAKDFLSSVKDIETRFFRASESCKEVSKMLEANKIQLSSSETKGRSQSVFLAALHLACCHKETVLAPHEPPQDVAKVIWNRSLSSQSSSSKNPLNSASKDDIDDSLSDFAEEFCMIAGSHRSTLDRLYAWERKLYDEVKASEYIRRGYEQKCKELKHLFARDVNTQMIDKTRAIAKDLHSRLGVALHAVELIAKRIEKLRDEELQPQLVELIQGLIRMWKAMLECHHAQYITISLAYHTKKSTVPSQGESHSEILTQFQHEIECFGSSFSNWIRAHKSYIEALNGWHQNCILMPRECSKARRAFSPRRALAPPIFVLYRDWSIRIETLPSQDLTNSIKALVSDLRSSMITKVEDQKKKQGSFDSHKNGEIEGKNEDSFLNLTKIHPNLTKVLDDLTKFSEASLKMYEEIRQGNEAARVAYTNCKTK
ncbi:hypothetical protein GIB67_038892 [Kingdonia uniflora]|uniref:Nitrate regulatory gene2 protein n=1 Tax=Kingdonia uniflora TaxID=39325 RepID=A0A7J7M2L1_9MAGN|nr:hypothetical protein GIB67_038892 [Kingdonia uniflora]